jgi:hypothetical protein
MGFETFIKKQIENRKLRLESPIFKAEMLREKTEFKDQLKKTGDTTLDFMYEGLGKKVLLGSINSIAKTIFNKKYGLGDFMQNGLKTTLDVTGMGLKTMWGIAKNAGKLGKIGIRQLIGK